MGIKISMQEKTQFFDEAWRKAGLLRHDNSFETLWKWPNEVGKRFMREIELRPGMKLVIFDFQPQENTVMRFEIEASPLDFGFCLSGNIRSSVTRSRGRKEIFISKPGESYVSFLPNSLGTIEYLAGQSILTVGIFVDILIFDTLLEGHFDEIPADFRRITDGSSKDNYVRTGFMTAAMQMAIHQILSCPYQGSIRRMYFESKAIELITHRLAQFEENRCEKTAQLYPDDIERLHEAKDILIRSMENAPTLLGLSRQVGLSDTKLKRGFRQVFGTTVFGEYGNYNTFRSGANISGPIIRDKLYLGLAGQYKTSDGFVENKFNDDNEAHKIDHLNGRATLRFTPADEWDISLIADVMDTDDHAGEGRYIDGPMKTDPFEVRHDSDEYSKQDSNGQTLRVKYSGDSFDFLSVSSLLYYKHDYLSGVDLWDDPMNKMELPSSYKDRQYSQELRISSAQNS